MNADTRAVGDRALEERRLQSLKGEALEFIKACRETKDPTVRRTFRGIVGSLHKVVFGDE